MDMTVIQKIVDSLAVKALIEERLIRNIGFMKFMEQIIEQRFAGRSFCPRCGCKHIKIKAWIRPFNKVAAKYWGHYM